MRRHTITLPDGAGRVVIEVDVDLFLLDAAKVNALGFALSSLRRLGTIETAEADEAPLPRPTVCDAPDDQEPELSETAADETVVEEPEPVAEEEDSPAPADEHRCDDCGRTFRTVHALNAHSRVHTAPRKLESVTCPTCGRTFSQPAGLGRHRTAGCPAATSTPATTDPAVDLAKVAEIIRTRPAGRKPWEAVARHYEIPESVARRHVIAASDAGLLPRVTDGGPIGRTVPFDPDAARARAAGGLGE